jgi:hypothetical protein
VLAPERLDLAPVAGDQRRRHQVGELRDEDLLGRVAHLRRIVDDERLRMDALEEMRRRDVGHVEGRILAQQHHVGLREVDPLGLAQGGMAALDVLDPQGLGRRGDAAVAQRQAVGRVVQEPVPAALRLDEEREGRVAGDPDALDRVHLDRDGEGHRLISVRRPYPPRPPGWQPAGRPPGPSAVNPRRP